MHFIITSVCVLFSPCPRRKEIDTLSGVIRGTSANRRRQFSGASSISSAGSTVSSGASSIASSGIFDRRSSNNNTASIGQVPDSPIPSPKFGGRHSAASNSRGSSPVHHPSITGGSSVSPAHESILMGSPQHNRHQMSPAHHHPSQAGTSGRNNHYEV